MAFVMPPYPSYEEQAANEMLHCYGCSMHAVFCPKCWADGFDESTACPCSGWACEDGHFCRPEWRKVNDITGDEL